MAEKTEQPASPPTSAPPVCEGCGNTGAVPVFRGRDYLKGRPGEFTVVRCESCGLRFQWPQLPWERLQTYYEGEYHAPLLRDTPSPLRRMVQRVGVLKQRWYVERFCRGGHLLDVGCGSGLFLEEMQHSGRWHLTGVEPDADVAATTREQLGIPVVPHLFEQANLPAASQDVITLWHVLEHVYAPRYVLHKAWHLLKPGGYLVFAVPNYESLSRLLFGRHWVGWDLPRHLFVFPRPVLRRMLHEARFHLVDQRCFLISYHSLGHTLDFWTQDWPPSLHGLAHWLRRAYATPLARVGLFPLQVLVERLGIATVMTWVAQKGMANEAPPTGDTSDS